MSNQIIASRTNDTRPASKNEFTIVGSVVSKFRPKEDIIILTVAVRVPGEDVLNHPQVTFYGKENAEILDTMEISIDRKPRVRIHGVVQTRRKEYDGVPRYFQTNVGDSIELTDTLLGSATGIEGIGRHKALGVNEVLFVGKVTHTFEIVKDEQSKGYVVTVQTTGDAITNRPQFTCFGANAEIASTLEDGDYIAVVGHISTKRVVKDGKATYYESVVANELAKIE